MSQTKTYTVTGVGFFPLGMLEIDGAEPLDTNEQRVIDSIRVPGTYELYSGEEPMTVAEFTLTVQTASEVTTSVTLITDLMLAPDVEGWNKYGWEVSNNAD